MAVRITSPDLDVFDRRTIVNRHGVSLHSFRATLTPRWIRTWVELLAGHVTLVATVLAILAVGGYAPRWLPLAVVLGAAVIGYTLAYIGLFLHEAVHYNLAPDRRWNDLLANLTVGVLIGQDVRAYRPLHFDHHRYLGTPDDTERTYFEPLDLRFFLESLAGIRALRVLFWREAVGAEAAATDGADRPSLVNPTLLAGLALHASVVGAACLTGHWGLALAWLAGVVVMFPCFAAVRQVLEHRDEEASAAIDYRRQPHGAVNRLFGDGPVASTLGGAGFNRHLLHHWEPQVACTRLRELEAFLLETPLADTVRQHQTTYRETAMLLMRSAGATREAADRR